MKISKDIRSISYLKARAADLLDQINETHRPVVITQNGEPRAVLQDPQSYERMRETIGLLKLVAMGEADIESGRTLTTAKVRDRVKRRVHSRGSRAK